MPADHGPSRGPRAEGEGGVAAGRANEEPVRSTAGAGGPHAARAGSAWSRSSPCQPPASGPAADLAAALKAFSAATAAVAATGATAWRGRWPERAERRLSFAPRCAVEPIGLPSWTAQWQAGRCKRASCLLRHSTLFNGTSAQALQEDEGRAGLGVGCGKTPPAKLVLFARPHPYEVSPCFSFSLSLDLPSFFPSVAISLPYPHP